MNPLLLGQRVNTIDPGMALRGQYGTFLVKFGEEELLVTCEPGHSISHITWANPKDYRPFNVTKITDPPVGGSAVVDNAA